MRIHVTSWSWAAALLLLPSLAGAQAVRGRVLDDRTAAPIAGALVELEDAAGKVLVQAVTLPSGTFSLVAPRPGRYLLRAAAIGYARVAPSDVTVGADGVTVPDVRLAVTVVTLPEIVALGGKRVCPRSGLTDDAFGRLLQSAQGALEVMEATVNSHLVAFGVRMVRTRTNASGPMHAVSDTTFGGLHEWPIQSVDPDSLRVWGFARPMRPEEGTGWFYYGPDLRVLFADWFLASHCFTLSRGKADDISLRLKFEPAQKSNRIDVSGELTFDRQSFALQRLTYTHQNLGSAMPDDAAGGDMTFAYLAAGVWLPTEWSIWAPIVTQRRTIARPTLTTSGGAGRPVVVSSVGAGVSAGPTPSLMGRVETKGQLINVTPIGH